MLSENQVKEELSISYVNAVAASGNFGCEFTRKDMDSIDITITSNGLMVPESTIRSPEIKIQLKATENLVANDSNYFPFPLSIKNYNDLRARTLAPRILVVLKLPSSRIDWITHSSDEIKIRNCAYWLSLHGLKETENTSNTTVFIPSTNIFSPEVLKEMMIKISKQENL